MKIQVFWKVMLCHWQVTPDIVTDYNAFTFRHYEPSKCLEPPARWYSITSQKTWIFSGIIYTISHHAFHKGVEMKVLWPLPT